MVFDPADRITVSEALQEPYVIWRDRSEELQSPPRWAYDGEIENRRDLSTDSWKGKATASSWVYFLGIIFNQMQTYRQNQS